MLRQRRWRGPRAARYVVRVEDGRVGVVFAGVHGASGRWRQCNDSDFGEMSVCCGWEGAAQGCGCGERRENRDVRIRCAEALNVKGGVTAIWID